MTYKQCDLDAKYFTALVTGLVKRQFGRDTTIDHALLKSQLFANSKMPTDKVNALLAEVERTLALAALDDWTVDALAKHLSQTDISALHAEVFKSVWKNERAKIHSGLVSKSVWSGSLSAPEASSTAAGQAAAAAAVAANPALASAPAAGVAWRIDVKAQSKAQRAINEPTAIVEVSYHPRGCATTAVAALRPEVVRFEMDRAAVNDVVTKLSAIEQLIQKLA